MSRIAIIGTAGRDTSRPMTLQLWWRMLADARQRVRAEDVLISGGAAWADHLAVTLYNDYRVKHLVLHLPAPLVDGRFVGEYRSAGSTANYYHDRFKRITGVDGLAELARAIKLGAEKTEQPAALGYSAMFARNDRVARGCDAVIAYTFGEGDQPMDGGTLYTWDQVKGERTHVSLLKMGNA